MYLELNLSIDYLHMLKWWVDAPYRVHKDLEGHTGMMMTMGKKVAMSLSQGRKLNAQNSNEAELIDIDNAIPDIMWRNTS